MRKGEITAFLSLVFVLLISFILGTLEASVVQVTKNLSRLKTDRAIYSIFGEYQQELLEQYHIFAIEGSYGTGSYDESSLVRRMHYYGTEGIDHEIAGIQYLTDNRGQAFREQVLAYMEQRYGISIAQDITGMTSSWEKQEIQGESMEKEEEQILEEFNDLTGGSEEGASLEESGENPFSFLEELENEGILSLVLPDDMKVSSKEVLPEKQVSCRGLTVGRGLFPARTGMDGVMEKLLFDEYVLKQFKSAVPEEKYTGKAEEILEEITGADLALPGSKGTDLALPGDTGTELVLPGDTGTKPALPEISSGNSKGEEKNDSRSLEYEVEYILSGKSSDKANLESVLFKIFLIRMAINYICLMGDSAKQSEAGVLALTIATLLLIPEAEEGIKQLVLLAWAAGESIMDIRALLAGNRVALIKNSENWQLSLTSLFTLGMGSNDQSGMDAAGGMTYKDYLRAFLFLENTDDATMRTLDRVEENISANEETDFFRADHCVSKIELKNTVRIYGNLTYDFPVYFGYL